MGPWPPLIERPRVEIVNTTRRQRITQQQLRDNNIQNIAELIEAVPELETPDLVPIPWQD